MKTLNTRSLAARVGITMAVTAATVAIPSIAEADYQCELYQVCFYRDKDGHGSPATLAALRQGTNAGVSWFGSHLFHDGGNLNDQASSVHNNTGEWVEIFKDGDYRGAKRRVAPWSWANLTGSWNDVASSAHMGYCDNNTEICDW